jgi:hypothetical protein
MPSLLWNQLSFARFQALNKLKRGCHMFQYEEYLLATPDDARYTSKWVHSSYVLPTYFQHSAGLSVTFIYSRHLYFRGHVTCAQSEQYSHKRISILEMAKSFSRALDRGCLSPRPTALLRSTVSGTSLLPSSNCIDSHRLLC